MSADDPNDDKKQELKRQLWAREDDLINHRLTWLGVTQTIIATATAVVAISAQPNPSIVELTDNAKFASLILALVGLSTSALIAVGIKAACDAQKSIDWRYQDQSGITDRTTKRGRFTALAIPIIFLFGWVFYLAFVGRKYFWALVCT
jgi:hypothetical protein